MPIRVVVADDHPLVLDGIEQLFQLDEGLELIARCRNGDEALDAVRRLHPDVLVLDLLMPSRDGLGVLHAIHNEGLGTRVVILTAGFDDEQLRQSIRLGARGIVLKEMPPHLLVEAVHEVHCGGEWLEQGVGAHALRQLRDRAAFRPEASPGLTAREIEIVRMVAAGLRNRAIGEKLFISEGTVKVHLHNIYEKLGVNGRFELIASARSRGLV
jgi:DNA-binding NarL/FixJ family response regulator